MIEIYKGISVFQNTMNKIKPLFASLVFTALFLSAPGCHRASPKAASVAPGSAPPLAKGPPPPPALAPLPEGGVKGIYLTGWTAGTNKALQNLLKLADRTEINAFVIDVKDDGLVAYKSTVPLVGKVGAAKRPMYKVDKVLAELKAHHIFPIARIACMRDSVLANARPDLAVQDAKGRVWHDRSHHAWLNPYQKAVWDYNVDLGIDAIKHGFAEVQFDYVRFPSEGAMNTRRFPGKPKDALREDQIAAFMKYAHDKIHAAGGWFSADVFGLTSLVKNDEGIGQKFSKVIQETDYLCPMVYPSHYHKGEYGIKNPDTDPYAILHVSLGDAVKGLKKTPNCKLRPWLQAFSLQSHYGPAQLNAQFKASRELGINEYLLWNAGCTYIAMESALGKKKK